MMRLAAAIVIVGSSLVAAQPLAADEILTRGRNLSVDVAGDGRVAIDLIGDIWIVPPGGGNATRLTHNLRSVQRPRWSPDASRIAYQAISEGKQGLWVYDFATGRSQRQNRLSRPP